MAIHKKTALLPAVIIFGIPYTEKRKSVVAVITTCLGIVKEPLIMLCVSSTVCRSEISSKRRSFVQLLSCFYWGLVQTSTAMSLWFGLLSARKQIFRSLKPQLSETLLQTFRKLCFTFCMYTGNRGFFFTPLCDVTSRYHALPKIVLVWTRLFACVWINVHLLPHYTDGIFLQFISFIFHCSIQK